MKKTLERALEIIGDVAGLLTLVLPIVALTLVRLEKPINWNAYIGGFLFFVAVTEFSKRHTLLRRLSADVASLSRAQG